MGLFPPYVVDLKYITYFCVKPHVLRDEWGFRGMVITDFDLYEFMYPDQAVAAGSDLILSTDAMKT